MFSLMLVSQWVDACLLGQSLARRGRPNGACLNQMGVRAFFISPPHFPLPPTLPS